MSMNINAVNFNITALNRLNIPHLALFPQADITMELH